MWYTFHHGVVWVLFNRQTFLHDLFTWELVGAWYLSLTHSYMKWVVSHLTHQTYQIYSLLMNLQTSRIFPSLLFHGFHEKFSLFLNCSPNSFISYESRILNFEFSQIFSTIRAVSEHVAVCHNNFTGWKNSWKFGSRDWKLVKPGGEQLIQSAKDCKFRYISTDWEIPNVRTPLLIQNSRKITEFWNLGMGKRSQCRCMDR